MLATMPSRPGAQRLLQRAQSLVRDRPQLAAGVCAFAIFAFAAWQVSPSVPGGDEPHYLVITQSLLLDGDLKIENNHRRGDYQAYYAGALAPHYIRRGANGEIYSIHAPGLSAVVAPAFALGGYPAVVFLLLVIASCGSALAWHLAWLATGRAAAAWYGWAAVTLAATTIFHSFTVYPDGLGSVIALTGVWALLRAEEERRTGESRLLPWLLHGAALALLPWLHSRFALLAGCIGALVLLRLSATKNPAGKAAAFLSVPAVSAVLWINFFRAIYGIADPSAPYGTVREFSLGFIPGGLAGLLFDQRFGLFANAPALIVGLAGLAMMLRVGRQASAATADSSGLADRRLALELLFVMVPYLLTATSYAMWWAGWSAPARFANPAVLILAVPCAVAWSRIQNRGSRAVAAGAAGLLRLSVVRARRHRWRPARLQHARDDRAVARLGIEAGARSPTALPSGSEARKARSPSTLAYGSVALALAWWCARALAGSGRFARTRPSAHGHYCGSHHRGHARGQRCLAASRCGTRAGGASRARRSPQAGSGAASARRSRSCRPVCCAGDGCSRCCRSNRRCCVALAGAGAAIRRSPSCRRFRLAAIACASRAAAQAAWLMLGIGQDQFALRSEAIAWPAPPIEIAFPVDVRALIVRGDEDAAPRQSAASSSSRCRFVPATRAPDEPRRAARGEVRRRVGVLSRRSQLRGAGRVLGRREPAVGVRRAARPAAVVGRAAPAQRADRESRDAGVWPVAEELTLAPGEERHVQVPLAPGQRAGAGDGDDEPRVPPVGIDARQPRRAVPGGVALSGQAGAPL